MKQKSTLLFLGLFLVLSCSNGSNQENLSLYKDFKRIQVDGDYSLMLPDYMEENKELHPDASLAYQHVVKEVAVLVLDENKGELQASMHLLEGYKDSCSFIENYINVQMNLIASSLGFPEFGVPVLKTIGELDAAQVWLDGQIEETPVAYFLSCVDAGEKVYLVMSYTSKEKKTKFEDTFQKIADSFLLISPVID